VIRQLDTSRFPDEAPPLRVPPEALTEAPAPASVGPLADDSSRLDYMVIYSDVARAAAGGEDAMRAEVYLGVEVANQAYLNSNVVQRLNLVYTGEIAYVESHDSSIDLGRVTNTSDGQLDLIPTLRDRYGADLVTFLVDAVEAGICGRGWVMTTVSTSFAPYAYNVVDRECASSNLSLAHELGHNMGGQHDWYVDDGTAPYSYAHGYVDVAHLWRTVMAYNSECAHQSPGVNCTRIPYFSNPSVSYMGNPTGVAAGTNTSCTAGNLSNPNCDADMRTTLNNTRTTVAAFRNASPGRSDAWMKDAWQDTGGEPDAYTVGQDMWRSPYLWVRNAQDVALVHEHEHQNPMDTATNYVYAKLLNGSESSMSGTLRLYWAEAAAGLAWPTDWTEFAAVAVTLSANSSKVAEATWVPSGLGHYCLLARWESASDPMHTAEGASVSANVRNNNNIIWKNVEVVPYTGPDCEQEREMLLIVRNVGNLAGEEVEQLDLILRPSMEMREEWLRYFDYVDLDMGRLMDNWKSMEGFEKVGETRLRLISGKSGVLQGISMKPREAEKIRVLAKASCKLFPADLTNLGFEVVQIALGDREPVGGVSYIVSMRPRQSEVVVVTGSKFDDRDKDGQWDEDGSEPPLEGWEIQADNLQGSLHFYDVTDEGGNYRLELPPDIYKITEAPQDGWVQTAPAGGEYRLDLREVAAGTVIHGLHFGNTQDRPGGDLGDAPDSSNHYGAAMTAYATVQARYPTVYGDPPQGGARGPLHLQPKARAWLGQEVSREWDADLAPDADLLTNLAPPANRANRDRFDDGIRPDRLTLPDCASTTFKYQVHVEGIGIQRWYANVWMDFNRDGDWEDTLECQAVGGRMVSVPEWAVQNQVVTLAAGDHTLETPEFVSARTPSARDPMWMRITLAEQTPPSPMEGSGPAGGYAYGETEDYLLGPAHTADLAIVKEAGDQFYYGHGAAYRLEVANKGTGAAEAPVTVQDELPVGLSFVSAEGQGWSCSAAYQTVTCDYSGDIAAGAEAAPIKLAVQVGLAGPKPIEQVRNCAAVHVAGDADETNNVSCVSTRLETKPEQAYRVYLPIIMKAYAR
jgi:uncharacterized repeat protein (TIGR01451 family)